ncbi:MAG: helicase [Myxococcales bacterium]|nr:helicase [Myxococcales bacterium]
MRVVVDNRLKLEFKPSESDLIEVIREDLTLETRSYITIRRRKRLTKRTYKLARGRDLKWSVPRGYRTRLWERLKEANVPVESVTDERTDGTPLNLTFAATLRPYQKAAIDRIIKERDGVICAPTGSGKTIMALGLIDQLQCSTLILVHTNALLHQMVERIEQFLGITPGIIGGGKEEPGPITVAMVQTLMRRPNSYLADDFGLVILDEAHHCPANTFRKVVQRFRARYRVGLTATPERKDGLQPILYAAVGPLVHQVDPNELREIGAILQIEVNPIFTPFEYAYKGDHTALIEALSTNDSRNRDIIQAVCGHHRQRSLVLTDRVLHAAELHERLRRFTSIRTACVVGETPAAEREQVFRALEQGDIEIIVATTALVGEGFDCPALDTLFLTIPIGSVPRLTQVIGRILRPHMDKGLPRVIDFVDWKIPALRRQFNLRKRVYRENVHPEHKAQLELRPPSQADTTAT